MIDHKKLIGKKFHRLSVVSLKRKSEKYKTGYIYYNCKCECGKKTIVYKSSLVSGKTRSCGCLKKEVLRGTQNACFIDITGKKFGKLTVLQYVCHKNNKSYWIVKCKCGNLSFTTGPRLRMGITKSCGCLLGGKMKSRPK